MNWIDYVFIIMTFSCMTGSIFYVFWLLFSGRIWRKLNPYISYIGLNLSLMMVFLPISYKIIIATQTNKEIVTTLLDRTTPTIRRIIRRLCIIWFVGMIVSLTLQELRQKRFNKALKVRVPVDTQTMEILEKQKKLLNITKVIDVYRCYNSTVPFITGIIKPTIYIPVEKYTDMELELIFTHELYHYKHHDTIWRKISVASSVVFWYNPLMKASMHYVSKWAEACCDASCMKHYKAKAYFATLLGMKNRSNDVHIPAFALRGEDKQMLWRIVTMRKRNKTRGKGIIAVTSVACMATLGSMGCTKAAGLINNVYYDCYMKTISSVAVEEESDDSFEDYVILENDGKVELEVSLSDIISDIEVVEPNYYSSNHISTEITGVRSGQMLVTGTMTFKAGEKILISSYGYPENKPYDIGIMTMDGNVKYTVCYGSEAHYFKIETAGRYSVYIKNESDVTMDIVISATRGSSVTK